MRAGLAQAAYSMALRALLPLVLARLWWRGAREPLYRQSIGERMGRYAPAPAGSDWVWVHAVSLGETRAALGLVQALRALHPELRLLLTHGTATGRAAGRELLREGDAQCWLPWDTPGAVRRFFAALRPRVGVLMETEVWPNLLQAARRADVPRVLANARLSPRSLRKAQRLRALMEPALAALSLTLAQTQADAQRLQQAGARDVEVTGNLKFDVAPEPGLLERGRAWRSALARPMVLAASTREGEEATLLPAWQAQPRPRPLLVLVPRHPQRFDEVAGLVAQCGLSLERRSGFADAPPVPACAADVWLGDSMGEMPLYYALADVALLGGSFAPLGGQNLIEAAACGCPVVMGPHTFNFAEAAELALAAQAALRVSGLDEGVRQAVALSASPRRGAMSGAALAFAQAHRGAAERTARRVLDLARARA